MAHELILFELLSAAHVDDVFGIEPLSHFLGALFSATGALLTSFGLLEGLEFALQVLLELLSLVLVSKA